MAGEMAGGGMVGKLAGHPGGGMVEKMAAGGMVGKLAGNPGGGMAGKLAVWGHATLGSWCGGCGRGRPVGHGCVWLGGGK